MATKTGMRVVRGPDWSHGNDDGGDGYLGTVTGIPGRGPNHGRVQVVWDAVDKEKTYLAGKDDKFELRLFDIGPVGIKHDQVNCDACRLSGVTGIRWKCAVCTDYDLCSRCYHGDRHDRGHAFFRYVTTDCKLTKVPPRNSSRRTEIFGLVKGAEVSRGAHWNYGSQDGGPGGRGKIVEVGTFSGGHYHGGVRVKWDHRPDNTMGYRVGAEGKVDLMARSKTSGGTYYPDHLPRLDVVNPDHVHLKRGDKVKVDVDLDTFKKLQKENQSGWNDSMIQCVKETGTIVAINHPSALRVQYEDARTWTVVRSVLQRLGSFSKGDTVQVIDSYNAAVELQVGHGGWNERMEDALGKTATIIDIDGDGDLRVEVNGYRWLMSPVSCSSVYNPRQQPREPSVKSEAEETSSKRIHGRRVGTEVLCSTVDEQVREFFQAADQGDVNKVRSFVTQNKAKINVRVKGNAALHVAAHHGHLDIVQLLLDAGADKNIKDDEGDTPLHYAVDGEQTAVLEELCKKGAYKDSQNKKGLTPLHVAVDQDLLDCVRVLVSNGADINLQDNDMDTPMHDAIRKGNPVVIRLLLDCDRLDGSRVNIEKLNIMHVAVINGQQKVVEVLIDRNRQLAATVGGVDNWAPLHLAAMNGRTAIAGILVKKGGVKINAADKNNRTALHYAVQSCENTIIDLLLGGDADPNIQDADGNTPAHLAQMAKLPTAGRKKKEEEDWLVQSILCMLAECGADLDRKNKAGKTPLDLCKTPQLVQKLRGIAERVKQESRDKDDIPPYWNSMHGKELVVQELRGNDALTCEEYNSVKQKFLRTMANVEILSIKRIQNRSLWDVYNVAKRTLERRYGLGSANELTLFHGTPAQSVEPIQHQNIDPLLAGNNVGAIWGKGAYFAVDAKQSDNYASASDEGYRYMFMARVLAGRYAQGSRNMQRPPPVDPNKPNELADTVVDNTDHPRIYVVFRNQQIYPEFLVQYM